MKKILLILLLILLVGCNVESNVNYEIKYNETLNKYNNFNEFHKYYVKGIIEYNAGETNQHIARYNYQLQSINYDNSELNEAYEYCVVARDLFSISNNYYQKGIAYFNKSFDVSNKEQKIIIKKYIQISNSAIEMNWNLYESCEYTESAIIYFYNEDYAAGNLRIEEGNKKIREHDRIIITHNKNMKELEVLLE